MARYRVVADRAVIEFFDQCSKQQRQKLLSILDGIAESLHVEPNYQIAGISGRMLDVRVLNGWEIAFWVDAPVKELRIVSIEKWPRRSR